MKRSVCLILSAMLISLIIANASFSGPYEKVSFSFGVVGKSKVEDKKVFEVRDSSAVYTDEMVRINYQIGKGYLYIIRKFSDGSFSLVVSTSQGEEATLKSKSTTWMGLMEGSGLETIYIIGSEKRLKNFEKLFNNPTGSSAENNRKIQKEVDALQKKSADVASKQLLGKKVETIISTAAVYRACQAKNAPLQQEVIPVEERPEVKLRNYNIDENYIPNRAVSEDVIVRTIRIIQKEPAK